VVPDSLVENVGVRNAITIAWLSALLLPGASTATWQLPAPLEFALGLYLADLLSGTIHGAVLDRLLLPNEDLRWTSERTSSPDAGERAVVHALHVRMAFGLTSNHHLFPRNYEDVSEATMLAHTMLLATGLSALKTCFGSSMVNGLMVGTTLAPLAHKWAHLRRHHGRDALPHPLVGALQDVGVLLRSDAHAEHHRHFGGKSLGLLNGWSDPVTDVLADVLRFIGVAYAKDSESRFLEGAPRRFRLQFEFPDGHQCEGVGWYKHEGGYIQRADINELN
jgi:hypothetical protein